ncbi:hypothetical protein Tsubulata_008993 [Turnera subulata]|uniref:ABC transporter domain-containing protein n=1 Tax=Turnera subulata TaxID=218843 RepID=A0A9Q0FKT2_9ROSI|nr:hypothetical protein Tsubulata_008993 [Turnera subulata]
MAALEGGDDLSVNHSGSWRSSSSFREIWNEPDVFRRSKRQEMGAEEEEEEELKWAAIERLPTYDRIRKSVVKKVLSNGRVVQELIDVRKLGNQEKKLLVDKILKVVEEDNEKFLMRLRNRIDRVGVEIPTIEVRYQNLSVEGDAYVGTRALPTLLNSTLNGLEAILGMIGLSPSKKRTIKILRDVSGILKPSRLTLVLGPPRAGKTTLLKALAAKLDDDLRVTGKVTYCGHEFSEFVPQRTCAYISQHDLHYGEMTVRETLDFSGRCLGVGSRYELLVELSRREKEAGIKPDPVIDAFMKATAVAGQETSLITEYVLKYGRLFKQFLAYFGIHQVALSLFRFLSALGRTEVVSTTLAAFTLLLVFVLGGFIISKNDIQSWLIWGYYVSPMTYGQNAISINEFLDDRWSGPSGDPNAPTLGISLLKEKGMFTTERWYWICIGALFGFSVLFNVLFLASLQYLNPFGDNKIIIDEGSDKNEKQQPVSSSEEMVPGTADRNGSSNDRYVNQLKKGMVLPFRPLSLAFNHVNYYVDMPAMFVEEVMELVELNLIRNAIVGLPGENGLSTEQRKRLTIAVELVANPSIIFMDEPTSGLDARAAAIVMRTVRNTVNTGRTVVCTIHQPSIDIFEAFDELLFLKRGGQVIYAGPLGRHSQKLVEYFEAVPGVPKIKEGYNPATWMLEVSSPALEAQLGVDFADVYAKSELYRANQELIKELSTPQPGSEDLYFPTKYSQNFLAQCKACFLKQHWSYWKNTKFNSMRFFLTILMGAMFGVIFWNKGGKLEKQQDLINLLGATYAAVLFLGSSNATAVQSVVAIERTVFYRERAAGMYSEFPYAIAQVAIETIYIAIQASIYTLLLYSMIGYDWKADKILSFYYFIFMCFSYFSMYGMMAVALTPGHQIAAVVMSFFLNFWNLFSGFLITRPQIPVWWRWYYWGSPVAWTIYGVIASQYGDIKRPIEIPGSKPMPVDKFLKDNLGFDHGFLVPVVLAHVGWVLLFLFVFACGIRFLNFQKR